LCVAFPPGPFEQQEIIVVLHDDTMRFAGSQNDDFVVLGAVGYRQGVAQQMLDSNPHGPSRVVW
jgi:hypothetical protein